MDLIGIVILNYKTYNDTIRLVRDLQTFKSYEHLRIVVVDNYSPNESYEKLINEFDSEKNVDVIQSGENGGYAKGNNFGLKYLNKYAPKFVLIVNNDVYFQEETLLNCINWYNKLEAPGIIAPVQYLPSGKTETFESLKCHSFFEDLLVYSIIYSKFKKAHQYKSNTSFSEIQNVDIIPGCFLFLSYNKFREIGFFNEETFLFCEERFLYKELNRKGYKNYIILNDRYIHDHSHTIKTEVSISNQKRLLHDGYLLFTKRYRSYYRLKSFLLNCAYIISKFESHLLFKI